jgi:MoxR-like ATPase
MSDQLYTWAEVETVVKHATTPVLIYGPPALGKTFISTAIDDCYSLTFTEDTSAAEVKGHFVPMGDHFELMHGPGVRGWTEGKRVVFNEINRGSGDVLSLCLALMDDPRFARLTLADSTTVRPKTPGYNAVATMNGRPEDLPEALQSRFAIRLEVFEVHPNALLALSQKYRQVATASVNGQSSFKSDIRQWYAFESLSKSIPEALAARAVFGHAHHDVMTALALVD